MAWHGVASRAKGLAQELTLQPCVLQRVGNAPAVHFPSLAVHLSCSLLPQLAALPSPLAPAALTPSNSTSPLPPPLYTAADGCSVSTSR